MNIDSHNHVVPPTVVDAIAKDPERYHTQIIDKDGKGYFTVHGPLAEERQAVCALTAKHLLGEA